MASMIIWRYLIKMEISYNFKSLGCLGNFVLHVYYLDKFCFSTLLTEYPESTVEFFVLQL